MPYNQDTIGNLSEKVKKAYSKPKIEVQEEDNRGNRYSLPYGLCKGVGIDTTGMTPREAWAAYTGETGISKEQAEKEHWGKNANEKQTAEKEEKSTTYSAQKGDTITSGGMKLKIVDVSADGEKILAEILEGKSPSGLRKPGDKILFHKNSPLAKQAQKQGENSERVDEEEQTAAEQNVSKGNAGKQDAPAVKNSPAQEATNVGRAYSSTEKVSPKKELKVKEMQELYDRIKSGKKTTLAEILADKGLQEAEKKYTVSSEEFTSNINTPERNALRKRIADEMNKRGSIGDKGFSGAVDKGFRAEIVLGKPAGGKSSVIVDKVSRNTNSRVLDSDEVKKELPEFDGGNGSGKIHTESADLILEKMMIPEYYKGGKHQGENIVIPIVGKKPRAAREYLKALKEAGYTVHLSLNRVTAENSAKRAVTRFAETGRFLSPTYIESVGDKPEQTFELLKQEGGFDTYFSFRRGYCQYGYCRQYAVFAA